MQGYNEKRRDKGGCCKDCAARRWRKVKKWTGGGAKVVEEGRKNG
jgi:hypothetical protein